MSLFLAQSAGTNNFEFADSQADIISISTMDTGVGFNESTPTTIEGVVCVEITYTRTQSGSTAIRLDQLVHDTGFTTPQQIIVMAVPNGTMFNGILVSAIAGVALPIGATGSPFANHICTIYDADDCNNSGHWVDKEGGGTTSFPRDVILYHELAHCFHFATSVTTSEPLAETDENDMRDVRGLPHRNTASHNGGCGGGPSPSCCIVASLATGSPYSEEVKCFRHLREHTLRNSMVGDDYFREFFYRYYGFSPEVTRLMGHQPNLNSLIKEYFVMPLLAGIEMLIYYVDNRGVGLAKFLRGQSTRENLLEIYQKDFIDELSKYLKIARNFDGKVVSLVLNNKSREYSGFKKLLQHINNETIKDEYIDWSLVSVVELWVENTLLLYSGNTEDEIDSDIYEKIIQWIALMPISNIWEEFSRLETEIELQYLEKFIFDSKSKEIFSERLIEKHSRYLETICRWAEVNEEAVCSKKKLSS